jgi:hypothetical protein
MSIKYLYIILFIPFLYACTTVPSSRQDNNTFIFARNDIKQISIKGTITSTLNNQVISADCSIKIAGIDSISITLFGPLGITAGKLYAREDYFVYYNVLTNEVFEGNPTSENLNRMIMIPLSYIDLIKSLRHEVVGESNDFKHVSDAGSSVILFKNIASGNYADFALFDDSNKCITRYQRKSLDGKVIYNIVYSDFSDFSGHILPKKDVFTFSSSEGGINLEISKIEINKPFETGFILKIPSGIKRNKI